MIKVIYSQYDRKQYVEDVHTLDENVLADIVKRHCTDIYAYFVNDITRIKVPIVTQGSVDLHVYNHKAGIVKVLNSSNVSLETLPMYTGRLDGS